MDERERKPLYEKTVTGRLILLPIKSFTSCKQVLKFFILSRVWRDLSFAPINNSLIDFLPRNGLTVYLSLLSPAELFSLLLNITDYRLYI